jgi:hypothetical protein
VRARVRKLNMEILSSGMTADWRSVGLNRNGTLVRYRLEWLCSRDDGSMKPHARQGLRVGGRPPTARSVLFRFALGSAVAIAVAVVGGYFPSIRSSTSGRRGA